jgi:hypothetical protein
MPAAVPQANRAMFIRALGQSQEYALSRTLVEAHKCMSGGTRPSGWLQCQWTMVGDR